MTGRTAQVDAAAAQLVDALKVQGITPASVVERAPGVPGILAYCIDLGDHRTLYASVYDGGEWRYGLTVKKVHPQTGVRLAYTPVTLAQNPAYIAVAARMTIDETKASA